MDRQVTSMLKPNIRLFNTPLEVGFRALVILHQFPDQSLDLEQLMYFDYLSLNTNDVGGPASLSAPIPNRGVQVYARKDLLQKGLTILLSKELIEFVGNERGFNYSISSAGKKVLELFSTKYFQELDNRTAWVSEKFGKMSVSELRLYMGENISHWGGEFL